ncbi:hypothetical protein [uncultured Muribaculum sp.]|uniref:hypothetical protein n=1 Tax=uncultured Muribaculum sp. TaxID=1918613 RepID=UPI0025AF6BCE|nr:hypothetical protein [uncultured Muribaculum sp.]
MQLMLPMRDSHEKRFGCSYYTTKGIYRCSILDMNMKFCENFRTSRISADKRFQKCLPTPAHIAPDRGFCFGGQLR